MQEIWFLRSARCLMLIDIYLKFREDSLNGFQVIERTDRQSPGVWENNMSPKPKRGGIIKGHCYSFNFMGANPVKLYFLSVLKRDLLVPSRVDRFLEKWPDEHFCKEEVTKVVSLIKHGGKTNQAYRAPFWISLVDFSQVLQRRRLCVACVASLCINLLMEKRVL